MAGPGIRRGAGLRGAATILAGVFLAAGAAGCNTHHPLDDRTERTLFDSIVSNYVQARYQFEPTAATADGVHTFDGTFGDRTRTGYEKRITIARTFLASVIGTRAAALDDERFYDRVILERALRSTLLDLETRRLWQRDPNHYLDLVTGGIHGLLKRRFGTPRDRLRHVVDRLEQVPDVLHAGEANLAEGRPPRVFTELALEEVDGAIGFFENTVPAEFGAQCKEIIEAAGARDNPEKALGSLERRFRLALIDALDVLREYRGWLKGTLLPLSDGSYALGSDLYRSLLRENEMVDTPLPELERMGIEELRRNQQAFREAAAALDPGRTPQEVLKDLAKDHPGAASLVDRTRETLEAIRQFCADRGIVSLPSEVRAAVAETPPFQRGLSFASMDTPGPFESDATEAYYYVTPVEKDWDAAKVEQHLSFFNRYALPLISIHEAYPGHYIHFLSLRKCPSILRRIHGCGSFAEGWAHYCEQMVLDEGFGGGDPRLRLAQLSLALLRCCRYLVSLKMHTQGMTREQAVEFFMTEGCLEKTNAEREARRGMSDPLYLVYTLGKLQILQLRQDARRQQGVAFRMREFHDRLISEGAPPIRLLRWKLLEGRPAKTEWATEMAPR